MNDHLGNCFNGERVEADGLTPFDLELSTFFVDPTTNDCYLPAEVTPINWFVDADDRGQTLVCDELPGSGFGPSIDDTTRVCRYLEFLDNQLQDSTRTDLTIMRLISLFRMYNDTTIVDEETVIPSCLTTYLDTTSICGIKMLLTMDSLVTTATLGSDTIRLRIQVQSTLTYLALQQWQNATEEDRDSLRLVYLQEVEKLIEIIEMKRTEEEQIWSTIDLSLIHI